MPNDTPDKPYTNYSSRNARFDQGFTRDFYCTPPWAARALGQVIGGRTETVLDPCAGNGHMMIGLKDVFNDVVGTDIAEPDPDNGPYMRHFLTADPPNPIIPGINFLALPQDAQDETRESAPEFAYPDNSADWVVMNPPFKMSEAFVLRAFKVARRGVAVLARTNFLETIGRYRAIFQPTPPNIVAPFVERVPMVKERCERKSTTQTSYAWFIWDLENPVPADGSPVIKFIPPCRKELERDGDYDDDVAGGNVEVRADNPGNETELDAAEAVETDPSESVLAGVGEVRAVPDPAPEIEVTTGDDHE